MLTFTTLGSCSFGNAALVSCGDTHILLDAGLSAKRIAARLQDLGVSPYKLSAILLTHEHSDHVAGLRVLSKKAGTPIYATSPTCRALYNRNSRNEIADLMRTMEAGTGIQIGSLWVESFHTPHDAACSVGYSIAGDGSRMAMCTDLGHVTEEVRQAAADCDLLVCEANYDAYMLYSGPYPNHLKRRIMGRCGHLANEEGAELAAFAVEHGTKNVVLAHLSETNNTPALAYEAVSQRLMDMGCDPERDISLSIAPHRMVGSTITLGAEATVC